MFFVFGLFTEAAEALAKAIYKNVFISPIIHVFSIKDVMGCMDIMIFFKQVNHIFGNIHATRLRPKLREESRYKNG